MLQARVQELERELAEKKKTKKEHLEKWDWLEGEYRKQCRATRCAQENLEKVQDELKVSNEMCMLKDQRIEELENESAVKKLASNGNEVCEIILFLDTRLKAVQVNYLFHRQKNAKIRRIFIY